MRILYITRAKLSLSRAHTVNIIKTAEYLNMQNESSVVVFSSAADPQTARAVFVAKGVKNFFSLNISSCSRSLLLMLWQERKKFDVLYFRDPKLWLHAFFVRIIFGKKIVFEVHGSHEWRFAWLWWELSIASADGIVFITEGLKKYYQPKKQNIVVHTNGVEMSAFEKPVDIRLLRRELNLPVDKKIIMYAGSFLWHSSSLVVEVSRRLPEGAVMVVVGLVDRDRKNKFFKDIISITRVEPKDIPRYLLAADILINPLTIQYPGSISSKLYEYLAAGKPIISSSGGANQELLHDEENGLLVQTSDATSFIEAIGRLLKDPGLCERLAYAAQQSAQRYSWDVRAAHITGLIKKL